MEFNDDRENNCSRIGPPIFGAIFMANRRTKVECLERNLFGLPPPQANFVKKVKSGMMLFLFEFEERKLYGVFQASSDGATNIVPHAFNSSGKQFPAQIRTKTIWYCDPLSERDFRDAIRDNYYTANKFNLGLSKDQVSKLLCLFNSRRIKNQKSKSPLSRKKVRNRSMRSDFARIVYEDDEQKPSNNSKNRLAMDNEPVNLVRHPGLSRSNSNVANVYLEPDSSNFGGQHGLPFLEHANNQYYSPYRSMTSSVMCEDSSAVGMDVKTSPEAFVAYSTSLADGVLSSSRSQVVPFHVEAADSSLPPRRSGSLGVLTNLGDFIPLDSQYHFEPISSNRQSPQSLSSRHRNANLTNPTSSRDGSFGRENRMSSFGPGKDPPYVPDHHYPAALRHEESPYSNYHPSAATTWCKSQLQVGVHPLDSRSIDLYGKLEQDNPTDVERDKDGAYIGLRSDIQNKRTSVFSRLKRSRIDTMQDDDNYRGKKDQDNTSVNQLMDMLNQFEKHWTKSTTKSRHNIGLNDVYDCSKSDNGLKECEDAILVSEEQQYYDVLVEETSVNFKRRNKFRKMQGEIEGCKEKSDGISCTLSHKRRKLLRPSFVSGRTHNDGIIGDRCPNAEGLSQEISECKDGGSSEARVETIIQELNGMTQ